MNLYDKILLVGSFLIPITILFGSLESDAIDAGELEKITEKPLNLVSSTLSENITSRQKERSLFVIEIGLQITNLSILINDFEKNSTLLNKAKERVQSTVITATDETDLNNIKDILRTSKNYLNDLDYMRIKINEKVKKLTTEAMDVMVDYDAKVRLIEKKIQEKDFELQKTNECLKDIQAGKMHDAQIKLKQIYEYGINYLLGKLYNKREGNFDLVLKFADNVTSAPQNFFIYAAFIVMEIDNSKYIKKNPYQLLQLVKSLRKNVIDQFIYSDSEYKIKTLGIENNLINRIKLESKEFLKMAILSKNRIPTIDELAKELVSFSYELFKEIINETVPDVIGQVGAEKIISYVNTSTDYEQRISGYTAIFNEVDHKNNSALFLLAFDLQNLTYYGYNPVVDADLDSLLNKIPKFMMKAVSSAVICIKNDYYSEYMYASRHLYENYTRHLPFSCLNQGNNGKECEDEPDKFKWRFEHDKGDIFRIKNVHYWEYLHVGSISTPCRTCRQALVSALNSSMNSYKWQVLPAGQNFGLKNIHTNEHLFVVSDKKYSDTERYVFTDTSGMMTFFSTWKVVDC